MAGAPIYLDQRGPFERMLPQMLQMFMGNKLQQRNLETERGYRKEEIAGQREYQKEVVQEERGYQAGQRTQNLAQGATQINVGGKPFVVTRGADGSIKSITQVKDQSESLPNLMQDFELTQFGKFVPEMRGSASYKAQRLKWIGQQKEASPYYATHLEGIERQLKMTAKQEGTGLRKEFVALPEVKQFSEYRLRYDVMDRALQESKTSKNMVAVDQAIITTFNKMTDPDSVVRESEYLRTSHDLALWNRIKGKVEKWKKGGAGLTMEDREALAKLGKQFHEVSENKYKEKIHEYREYLKEYGLEPDKYLKIPKWMNTGDYDYEFINGKLIPVK